MITIRKYPNRRLYNTDSSQYVNLEAIRDLVLQHEEFEVVDSKTGEDLTKSILLQIVTEQETSEAQSLLTNNLLKQLIRFYGDDMQPFLRKYLERSLKVFLEQQDSVQSLFRGVLGGKSVQRFNETFEQEMKRWFSLIPSNRRHDD